MPARPLWFPIRLLLTAGLLAAVVGCSGRPRAGGAVSPVAAGLNTNDLIDPPAQVEADHLGNTREMFEEAERMKAVRAAERKGEAAAGPRRSILCLSGGGALGAYSAGVLCGWTARGDRPGCGGRPNFDVVTGISTGALLAPLAFLGPAYDDQAKRVFTTVHGDDIFHLRPVRGLFGAALADNAPLARLVREVLSDEVVQAIAAEHRAGRRLYIGTTELEGRRFVFWDIGAIANRGCPDDRDLIARVLLGSSAIPGFFPPSEIPVTVDGKRYVEKHGDGGASCGIFYRPPYVPPERWTPEGKDLSDVDLYMIVAGKLYSDASPLRSRSLLLAGSSVSAVLYSETRGDLQRMYLVSLLKGMSYHLAAVPPEYAGPMNATEFEPGPMGELFAEGYRQSVAGAAWRNTPPGVEPGESMLKRQGTALTHQPRGRASGVVLGSDGKPVRPTLGVELAPGPLPVPVSPGYPLTK
mgnify:CR=1 FL=1